MNLICIVEGCGHLAERNGICGTHNREARKKAAPKEKPRKMRISKQSEEGKERTAVYNGIRQVFLTLNDVCERCSLEYSIWTKSTQVHHKRGRIGDLLYDVRYFLPVCSSCHKWIEAHPQEAYEKGWSLLRNANESHTI